MRYVVAMVFAIVVAGLAAVFLSSPVADWVVSHQRFDSSDDAENLHMLTFIGTNVVALLVGWLVGWTIAGGRQAA
jgi:hypothetical protein